MLARRKAREFALQFLFSEEFRNTKDLNKDLNIFKKNFEIDNDVFSYTEEIVHGVFENQSTIDKLIEDNLKSWKLDRISHVERNILRLSIYEIIFKKIDPVPFKASINEALEIAKKFGNTESSRFINGILDQIAKTAHP